MGCGFSQPTTSNGGALLTFAQRPNFKADLFALMSGPPYAAGPWRL
jgi:hypothetical protein